MITEEEIVADKSLKASEESLLKLKKRLDETEWSNWRCERPTIFRVHKQLRDVDKVAYEPKIISFGPYHRANERLTAMENLKWLYLKNFLARNPEMRLEDYMAEIRRLELRARSAYFEEVKMESDEFVEMMLLDGCFIVELLLSRYVDHDKNQEVTSVDQFEDPIRSTRWARSTIMHDMLILENQLPFFLLERLLNLSTPSPEFHNLAMHPLISFFLYLILPNYKHSHGDYLKNVIEIGRTTKPYHFLHLFHILVTDRGPQKEDVILQIKQLLESLKSIDPEFEKVMKHSKFKSCSLTRFIGRTIRKLRGKFRVYLCSFWGRGIVCEAIYLVVGKVSSVLVLIFKNLCCCRTRKGMRLDDTIPSATNLKDAGLKFRRKEKPLNFLNITFEGNVLEIPQLRIYDSTNCLLRNLIAFEQCCQGVGDDVSHYAAFMDRIIDTPEDVEILQQKEIIYNGLGSHENIASLFNHMCDGVFVNSEKSYLINIIKEVNNFSNTRCNRWRAKLNRDYFGNPWAIVSLLAAAFLLILTVLQSIFALLAYFKPPS